MLRIVSAFGLALVATLIIGNSASAQKSTATAEQFQKALTTAQELVPEGILIKSRVEKAGKVFGFYFLQNGFIREVEISITGKVVKDEKSDAADTKVVSADVLKLIGQKKAAKTKLPDGRLLEIAAESLKDAPFSEMIYEKVGDTLVLKVGDLVLDATTGKPVK